MKPTDQVLQALIEAFDQIDWKQPQAHRVYEEIMVVMNNVVTDTNNCSWHEFYLWQMGATYAHAAENRSRIPPVSTNHKDSIKEGKQE